MRGVRLRQVPVDEPVVLEIRAQLGRGLAAAEVDPREELAGFDDSPGVAARTCHDADPMSRLFNTQGLCRAYRRGMTKPISELLDAAARRAVPVVRGITEDQLSDPTPCAEYDVRTLTDHLIQVLINFQKLAAKEESDFGAEPHYMEGDWRSRFADEVAHSSRRGRHPAPRRAPPGAWASRPGPSPTWRWAI